MKVRLFDYTTQLYEYLLEHEEADTVDPVLFERLVKRTKRQVLKKSAKAKTLADKKKEDKKKEKENKNLKDSEKLKDKGSAIDKKKGEPTIEFNTSKENKKNTKDTKVVNLGPINSRMIGELVKLLREGPVRFSYKKKNNERRNAIGTLEPDVVRKHIKGTGAPKPPTVLPYIELDPNGIGSPAAKPRYDKAAWRSFRKNLLQSFKPISM